MDEFREKFLENYQNARPKMAFYADDFNMNVLNAACKCINLVLDEELYGDQCLLSLVDKYHLSHLIAKNVERLVSFGILQHRFDYHKWLLLERWEQDIDGDPQVLTVDSLEFGFVIWLSACGICCLQFSVELISLTMRRYLRTLIGLVLFLQLVYVRLNTCAYL